MPKPTNNLERLVLELLFHLKCGHMISSAHLPIMFPLGQNQVIQPFFWLITYCVWIYAPIYICVCVKIYVYIIHIRNKAEH